MRPVLPYSAENTGNPAMAKKKKTKAPKKRGRGRPKKNVLTKAKLEECVACLEVGGTFEEAAGIVGVHHSAIFYHMRKHETFYDKVMRARALGVEFRKMVLEDSIFVALNKIKDDPRYTVLVIFAAKAQLKWSDLPEDAQQDNQLKEVLATIVEKKKSLSQGKKGGVLEYSQKEVKEQVK